MGLTGRLSASPIDLEAFAATPLARDPYDHVIVPGFIREAALAGVLDDFPRIDRPGSFPLDELKFGAAFARLIEALGAPELADAFAEKFSVALDQRPRLVTVRGRCGPDDGRIHTDSTTKILTVLIYVNPSWDQPGGRIRVLRGPDDLEDYAAEVPPQAGTLFAFRRGERSFHGHHPFVGARRVVQLNWMTGAGVARRAHWRHRLSSLTKRLTSAGVS